MTAAVSAPHSSQDRHTTRCNRDFCLIKTDHIADNILIAILAVNGWTANRVFPLTERFRAVGLLDFSAMSDLSIEDIADRLARAGYARGEYMNLLLAERLLSWQQPSPRPN